MDLFIFILASFRLKNQVLNDLGKVSWNERRFSPKQKTPLNSRDKGFSYRFTI